MSGTAAQENTKQATAWRSAKLYLNAAYYRVRFGRAFDAVSTYCMFIGYPRSGHSLVGALLDAHPQIVIAHEADALKYLESGFGKAGIYSVLLSKARDFADSGSTWSGYSYKVPDQWNGRFENLRVIGDKKGGKSTRRLTDSPDLLPSLQRTLNVPLKLLHVIRNPYDNISTICRRRRGHDLAAAVDFYFRLCETNAQVRQLVDAKHVIEIRLESVIEDPRRALRELCAFVGVEPSNDYLEACSSIVFKSPRRSRHDVQWSDELKRTVADQIERFPFLHGYRYDE